MSATQTPVLVTEIPTPWLHPFGKVTGVEYPADRPNVVDLVLSTGHRTTETRTARYLRGRDGVWDLARFVATAPDAPVPAFGDPEVITVAELQVSDFVLTIPAQRGTRGASASSAIREISPEHWDRWTLGKMPVASRLIKFHDPKLAALDVPSTHTVTVRRVLP